MFEDIVINVIEGPDGPIYISAETMFSLLDQGVDGALDIEILSPEEAREKLADTSLSDEDKDGEYVRYLEEQVGNAKQNINELLTNIENALDDGTLPHTDEVKELQEELRALYTYLSDVEWCLRNPEPGVTQQDLGKMYYPSITRALESVDFEPPQKNPPLVS